MKKLLFLLLFPLLFLILLLTSPKASACEGMHAKAATASVEKKADCPMAGKTANHAPCTKSMQAACAKSAHGGMKMMNVNHHHGEMKTGASCPLQCNATSVIGAVGLAFAMIFGFVTLFRNVKI